MKNIEQRLKKSARAGDSKLVAARFVERAVAEGLADVVFATIDSPVGKLVVFRTRRGLVRLGLSGERVDDVIQDVSERVSPRILEAPWQLDDVRRELDEYFAGRRKTFDLPLDWQLTHGFSREVLRATARIPYGKVSTYGAVAAKAGSPRAARAAGNALGSNPIPIVVPCHRVLWSSGGLGGYGGGLPMKRSLLRLEGSLKE